MGRREAASMTETPDIPEVQPREPVAQTGVVVDRAALAKLEIQLDRIATAMEKMVVAVEQLAP